jgi:site-specific DNA-adenine methylase
VKIDFPFPGGKAKIRDELFPFFPEDGDVYIEPFVGRGNIFFEWYKRSCFKGFWINDLYNWRFFTSLKQADLALLPDEVHDYNFENWVTKWIIGDPIAYVLEPKITFRGKGYLSGFQVGRYHKTRYTRLLSAAQCIVRDSRVQITGTDYTHLPWDSYDEEDFCYLDPPYEDSKGVGLGSIDHSELITILKKTKCRWALSGYQSELYLRELGDPVLELNRHIEMTDEPGSMALECLWTNY